MTPPTTKVDMAQMNAAIDKVLALPAATQAEVAKKVRSPRKAEHPPPIKSSKSVAPSSAR